MAKPPQKEIALETRVSAEGRLFSPSAARNQGPIRDAFLRTMPSAGVIVEVGSGTGEHVAHLAAAAPGLFFRPGDPDPASRASIAAWTAHLSLANVAAPHEADVTHADWHRSFGRADGVVSINMIHIAPFEAAAGLIAGAGQLLRAGGKLFLYGPFSRDGVHAASSNADFDASLKARDPRWGVRDLERQIAPLAKACAFALEEVIDMPANNLVAVFSK